MKHRILRAVACALAAVLLAGTAACSPKDAAAKQELVFLNFKPESASAYEKIAKEYENQTGVRITVNTAASGEYEQTLKSEIAKSDAPTIFQINGPKGYASWKNYCADLKSSELYAHLTDKSMAIEADGGVYGIPYVVEGYGIIYNQAIMDKYFALDGAKATSIEQINSFARLKAVVGDMTEKKAQLGIEGVFASTSLKPGEDWRWQTHLANLPIYYEFAENGVDLTGAGTDEIAFSYAEQFRNIFDLYTDHSVSDKKLLGSRVVDDSMAEFALGKCAMVQNGNWAWSQISSIAGNTVEEKDMKFLPIYIGVQGEEKQSICVGTENYFAINAKQSAEKQQLALDFLWWLFSSEKGKQLVTEELGFITPFDTFSADELPADPLAREVSRYMNDDSLYNVPWVFPVFPSAVFKNNFGAALLSYVQGNTSWDEVRELVVRDWREESAAS